MAQFSIKNIFPEDHSSSYVVEAARVDGERELARLATTSKYEYAWEYDENQSLWRHLPAHHHSRNRRQFLFLGKVVGQRMGLALVDWPPTPSSDNSTFYHTHPLRNYYKMRRNKNAASFSVQSQLPSSEDVKSSVIFSRDGFKDSRIVTALGVTSLALNLEMAWESGKFEVKLPGFAFSVEELAAQAKQNGAIDTIQNVFGQINSTYEGKLILGFSAFD